MNPHILKSEVQQFITQNSNRSVADIALSSSPFEGVAASELAQQIDGKQRLKKKVPQWVNTAGIYYPERRSLEQCSSISTADYKANLIVGDKILDMTGGMGVDTWAIAKKSKEVVYCEQHNELFHISRHNFKILNADSIITHYGDALELLSNSGQFSCIYIDPARRDEHNRKMVSFADCQPDVLTNMPLLWEHTAKIMIKASPMMDISQAISELQNVTQVHIVAVKNECKELLFILEKDTIKPITFFAVNLEAEHQPVFSFAEQEMETSKVHFDFPQQYIYEPNSAVLKSGAFNLLAAKYNISKLHHFTHLYTSTQMIENFSGNIYILKHRCDYNKKMIKKILPKKQVNVKCYNFIDKPAVLQKRLQIKDGGTQFLFGIKNKDDKYELLLCEKITVQ